MSARLGSVAALAAVLLPAAALPGPRSLPAAGVLSAVGRIKAGGLEGEWRSLDDLSRGAFAVHSDFGVYRTADVYDGRTRWRVEPSGGSHPLDSQFAKRAAATEAWLARFAWLRGDFGGATRLRPKSAADADRRYRILTAIPPGGVPVELWFDAYDGRLAKAVRPAWFYKLTTTYGDYRAVAGQYLPFEIVNSSPGGDERVDIQAYHFTGKALPGSFGRPRPPDDFSIAAVGTTVPVVVFPQLALRASVNGRPMDFVFDTGGHSILTPDAANALGLKVVGNRQSGGSGAGTLSQRDTRVNELRIGDAVLRDQHFAVLSFPYASVEQGAKPPLAGLLGLEVAERFIVRLNYREGTLTLLPRSATPKCQSKWRDLRFTDDMPTIDAVLDGIPAKFTIDTGNNGSLMLYRQWMKRQGVEEKYDRGVEAVSYGAGGASRNWVSFARSFSIGKRPISRPMVRTTDDKGGVALSVSEAGNLGTYLLANYTITLDYARSRACFDYVPGYRPVPFNRAAMRAIKPDPGYFLVTLVNTGGPAAQAGLRKDDRIVAVDGVSASTLSAGDLTLALTRVPGSHVTIRYERDGTTREAVVTTREILP